ncbi:hypothetical protein NB696_000504 [Xanthomonas sacchari]|uniref:hypothetical protein n=1 Tax=Xanthomonas TaxID=338 RepID=UPI0022573220|nr:MULTISPECIES: hypothetical protein [Xanthomonas]MCW0393818.1 hypothetical protein [Xanthomonas sacchari]MCW0443632.1 hypothetical protein [Xanthomonas sacchari]MDY4297495.1 hypothetical protein [Xanthomonas sp. LF02-5]MDY4341885.1 hypothetical protein [Xanthomonas sp. LF07-6]MDY4359289.1 hypothetical protein [Xanthomonas sp. LF04-12]
MAIDTALSPLGTVTPYGTSPYGFSAASASSGSAQAGNPIVASNDPAAVQQAVELSGEASVIFSLGGLAGTTPADTGLTYNAAGLFNSIVSAGPSDVASSAGTSTSTAGASTSTGTAPYPTLDQATQTYDQGLLGTITAPPSTPGLYNASGVFSSQGLTPQLSSLLQSDPSLSGTVTGDLLNQGIVGGLIDTTA